MKRTRIGFPLCRSSGGPETFMRRLRESIDRQRLARTCTFLDPRSMVNLYKSTVRNPFSKPYVFRVDGIYVDSEETYGSNEERNQPIFDAIAGASGVIVISEFSLQLLKAYMRIHPPYEVIHNAVNLSHFRPDGPDMRSTLGIGEEEVVAVTSAKWRAHKRLSDTVRLFQVFAGRSRHPCTLLVLGDTEGAALDNGKRSAMTNGDTRVIFAGHQDPESLPAWYRSGDVFLFLSWLDSCPNSVAEAIACGLPVVCSNQGGTKELVQAAKAGVVASADEDYEFGLVSLYDPPAPDYDPLLDALEDVVANREEWASRIDRSAIDIDAAARKYVGFIEAVLRGDAGSRRKPVRTE